MRSAIVPSQITSVEDMVVGSISFSQLFLFLGAVGTSYLLYAVVPLPYQLSIVKVIVILFVSSVFLILSIRIKNRILLTWIKILLSYVMRPKYYVFNKNEYFMRENKSILKTASIPRLVSSKSIYKKFSNKSSISPMQFIPRITDALAPRRNVRLVFVKKGGIRVIYSKV